MAKEVRKKDRPSLIVHALNIPEAFEKAMEKVWNEGISIETEYDKPGDPPSKDAQVTIHISQPFSQPRFHRAFSDGLGGVAEYVQEVVNGAHNHWVRPFESIMEEIRTGKKIDPKWIYTYYQRLFESPFRDENGEMKKLNQIERMAQKLAHSPNSRRAQATTWVPWIDSFLDDPPCLQRVWARIFQDEDGRLYLNMDTDWRSRDLFKAWFENTIALTTLQSRLAERITEIRIKDMGLEGETGGYQKAALINVGPYTDKSNSLHIYGSYFHEVEGDPKAGVNSFFQQLEKRPFSSDSMETASSRTYTSEQVRIFFINDGVGKGLENMVEREAREMPPETLALVKKDLERLKEDSYTP
jgi:thymidylate synthase